LKYTIDRFEGNYAVCEDEHGNMSNIDRKKLPITAVEGNVLVPHLSRFVIDQNETDKRKKGIQGLFKELWRD
jgi:hypothetical protein